MTIIVPVFIYDECAPDIFALKPLSSEKQVYQCLAIFDRLADFTTGNPEKPDQGDLVIYLRSVSGNVIAWFVLTVGKLN
jgi:hypothetical protein